MDNNSENPNDQEVHNIHDKFFRDIYGRPSNAVGFLKDFLPSSILDSLDLDTVTVRKKSYLSEEYKEHYNDLVVKTSLQGSNELAFVYFLLEHKSSVHGRSALQMLRYMVEQWYELEKQGLLVGKLPPIFPILIYHGPGGWTPGLYFQDIVNLPHEDMKPYIPDFQYFLSDAVRENEENYTSSVVIQCWFIVMKYIKEPAMRDKLFDILQLLHRYLDLEAATEYIEIFLQYLAKTENPVTRKDAARAIETIFPEGGTDMIKGWAKEYAEEGMLTEVRENVLEALDAKFSTNIPADVQRKINALNNRAILKRLLRSTFQSKDMEDFRRTLDEIAPDQPGE